MNRRGFLAGLAAMPAGDFALGGIVPERLPPPGGMMTLHPAETVIRLRSPDGVRRALAAIGSVGREMEHRPEIVAEAGAVVARDRRPRFAA
ncbi:MAG: hypothetical protein AB7P02_25200 [Alphaproteobacteria bacterium]